jgi:hypothetical protein
MAERHMIIDVLMASHFVDVSKLPRSCRLDKKLHVITCNLTKAQVAQQCFAYRPGCSYARHKPCVIIIDRDSPIYGRVFNHELDHCHGMVHG